MWPDKVRGLKLTRNPSELSCFKLVVAVAVVAVVIAGVAVVVAVACITGIAAASKCRATVQPRRKDRLVSLITLPTDMKPPYVRVGTCTASLT